jgi:hypothetical protein
VLGSAGEEAGGAGGGDAGGLAAAQDLGKMLFALQLITTRPASLSDSHSSNSDSNSGSNSSASSSASNLHQIRLQINDMLKSNIASSANIDRLCLYYFK